MKQWLCPLSCVTLLVGCSSGEVPIVPDCPAIPTFLLGQIEAVDKVPSCLTVDTYSTDLLSVDVEAVAGSTELLTLL